MRAAALAIASVGERLPVARVAYRIPHRYAQGCGIRQDRPLQNGSQNQGDGDETTVHGSNSVLQRWWLRTLTGSKWVRLGLRH